MKKRNMFFFAILIIAAMAYFAIGGLDHVTLDSPANGTWSSSSSVTFNCTAVTNLTQEAVGNMSLLLGLVSDGTTSINQTNQSVVTNDTTFAFTVTNIPDGKYHWSCQAANSSLFEAVKNTTNYTVYVDTQAVQNITLNAPANGFNSSESTLDLNWTAFDNVAENFLCNLSIGGVVNATVMVANDTLENKQVADFADGTYNWNVTCWDPTNATSHRNSSATWHFTVDTIVPAIEITSPTNTTYNTNESLELTVSTSDVSTAVSGCYYTLDGGSQVIFDCSSTKLFNVSANAAHNITVYVNDTVNNTNSSSVVFNNDIVVPHTISLNAPDDGNVTTIRNVTFNWSAYDNIDQNISCNLSLNSVMNWSSGYGIPNGTTREYEVKSIPDDIYWWNITCWDDAGNSNVSELRNFTVDLDAPSVTLGVTDGTWFATGTSIKLNYTAFDPTVDKCLLQGDFNGTWALKNQSHSGTHNTLKNFVGLNLTEGTYSWNVNCSDDFGRNATASANRTFYVDLNDPTAKVTLSTTLVTLYNSVTITCSGSDSLDSTLDNTLESVKFPDGKYSSDLDGTFGDTIQVGTYTVKCKSVDSSGREDYVTTTFSASTSSSAEGDGGSSSSSSGTPITSVGGESHVVSLQAEQEVKVEMDEPEEVGVKEIRIETTEDIVGAEIKVDKLAAKPASISAAPLGKKLHSYLEISAPETEGKLKQAKIRFDVKKSWLESNGVQASDVVLMRFTDDWEELETRSIGGTSDAVTFEAVTSGFSTFAITAKKAEEAEEAEEEVAEEEEAEEEAVEEAEAKPVWPYVVLVLVLLAVIGAVVFFMKKKQ